MKDIKTYSGIIVNIESRLFFKGTVTVSNGIIVSILPSENVPDQYILPGFIDAHIHIESSMLTPVTFAEMAVKHGTIATISDPHEIANVCGLEGVQFMIENARDAPIKVFFGAPSCVPATNFEHAGACLDSMAVDNLLASDDIYYLSEMMNYPGVLNSDNEVLTKIASAIKYNKPIDGHAPGLRGQLAQKYISHGISTDHECTTLDEAKDKLSFGMKIIIREGSAAKNFESLHPIIASHPEMVMFCSDDKHPDDLLIGHISLLVKRALAYGYDLFDVLKIACINPVDHYKIPVGKLKTGDPADFIIVNNLSDFDTLQTIINGVDVNGIEVKQDISNPINTFNINEITVESLQLYANDRQAFPVIVAIDGSLVTEKDFVSLPVVNGMVQTNPKKDILKICVINRYFEAQPSIGFIKNFGLLNCAIASTVAHDSHNIICIGDEDELMINAINLLIKSKGGLSAVTKKESKNLPLPIAGLMSDKSCEEVGKTYQELTNFVKVNGCSLHAPFMTLSFMALLVIPKIKISDMGMFDAETFNFY
ncbi:MAG: adenine deaminase [Saprospiraceae bacterium]|nr:adenine deaminase [Saprospiraceae bacterium]